MKKIDTGTYNIQIDDEVFPLIKQLGNVVKAETIGMQENEKVPAYISAAISEYDSNTPRQQLLETKLSAFKEYSWATILLGEEDLLVNGLEGKICKLSSDEEDLTRPRIYYCVAWLFIGERYLLQVRCEADYLLAGNYVPVFLEAIYSINYNSGDIESAVKQDEQLMQQAFHKLQQAISPPPAAVPPAVNGWVWASKDYFKVAYPEEFNDVKEFPQATNATKNRLESGEAVEATLDMGMWPVAKMKAATGNREADMSEDFIIGLTTDMDTMREDCLLLSKRQFQVQGMEAWEMNWKVTYRDWASLFPGRLPELYFRCFTIFAEDNSHYFYLNLCCDYTLSGRYGPMMDELVGTFRRTTRPLPEV